MKFGEVFDNILEISKTDLTPTEAYLWLILLYRARQQNYQPVSISREELAEWLAVSTRTVQRAIKRLESMGAIEVERMPKLPSRYKIIAAAFKGDIQGDTGETPRETPRETQPPRVSPSTNLASTKLNYTKLTRVGHSANNVSNNCLQSPQKEKPKRLSMWVLKNRKEACEAELKKLRNDGWEDAMSFHYANKADRLRARELKNTVRELNREMIDAC